MQFENNIGIMLSNVTQNREMGLRYKANFLNDLENLKHHMDTIRGNYTVPTYYLYKIKSNFIL